jgi:hypothetical protein
MFRYKLHWANGSEAGDASYAINIKPGDLIWIPSPNRQLRVLELVEIVERTRHIGGCSRWRQPNPAASD